MQEQQRVQEMGLAAAYNKSLYFNRKLGDTAEPPSLPTTPFFRAYHPDTRERQPEIASQSYPGQPSSTRLAPEMVTQVNQILAQGQRLGIEYVDERRFRTNSWNCYGTVEGKGAEAMALLESCLDQYPEHYIRLVAIHPQDRRRLQEVVIQRPSTPK